MHAKKRKEAFHESQGRARLSSRAAKIFRSANFSPLRFTDGRGVWSSAARWDEWELKRAEARASFPLFVSVRN